MPSSDKLSGCLMGLMCGDALGAPVEFKTPADLHKRYPQGVSTMVAGWGSTATRRAGDITDDSEMALALLRSLREIPTYSAKLTREAYLDWHLTAPDNEGLTIARALEGLSSPESEANGALMRIAPLAIVSLLHPQLDWQQAAAADAALTHVHLKCAQANIIFVESLRLAMLGHSREHIHSAAVARAQQLGATALLSRLESARTREPAYLEHAGWLEIAFHAAYYHLLHARDFSSALCRVVNHLGDPDTNGAIAGALLGAFFGLSSIPTNWREAVLHGSPDRPARYRPPYGMGLLQSFTAEQ